MGSKLDKIYINNEDIKIDQKRIIPKGSVLFYKNSEELVYYYKDGIMSWKIFDVPEDILIKNKDSFVVLERSYYHIESDLNLTEKSWISIEDKLPQDAYPKLFYDDKTNIFGLFGYKYGLFYKINDDDTKRLMSKTEITHWFDIPQPPVKDEFKKNKHHG